jgi:fimbrial chaperone protein
MTGLLSGRRRRADPRAAKQPHYARAYCGFVALLLLCCALGWAGRAGAANLQISPVMINFAAAQGAAGINLQNQGDTPLFGQVRVYVWDQVNGEDVLTPTQDVVASPPLVQIAPRGSQTIRLVRTGDRGTAQERTYRVLIDEVARDDGPATSGVDIRLRYSVPVFVAAADAAGQEALSWTFFRKDGSWMVRIVNAGIRHAQIGAWSVSNRAGKEFSISQGLFGYVLPGRSREWRLPVDKDADLGGALTIKVSVNARSLIAHNTTP